MEVISMALEFMINEKVFPQFKELVNKEGVKKLWLSFGPNGLFATVNDKEVIHVTSDPVKKPEPTPTPELKPPATPPANPPT